MPTIILKLNRLNAVNVCESIRHMGGEGAYKAAREQFMRAILKAYPEITDANKITPPELECSVEFNPKQQRAMAEGLLFLCNDPARKGDEFSHYRTVAETLRLWPWVETHLNTKTIEDFDFPLAGEPELVCEPGSDAG